MPDVSGLADVTPGYATYCSARPDCVDAQHSDPWQAVGGTSAATPLLAGAIALINEDLHRQGKQFVGRLNPLLYRGGHAASAAAAAASAAAAAAAAAAAPAAAEGGAAASAAAAAAANPPADPERVAVDPVRPAPAAQPQDHRHDELLGRVQGGLVVVSIHGGATLTLQSSSST